MIQEWNNYFDFYENIKNTLIVYCSNFENKCGILTELIGVCNYMVYHSIQHIIIEWMHHVKINAIN